MKRSKPTTLPLGTISEGTLRPEDLIPAYLSALEGLRLTKAERATVRLAQRECKRYASPVSNNSVYSLEFDDLDLVGDLTAILESHVPDYAYFGTLEGDGACFGVWANIELLEEDARDATVIKTDGPPTRVSALPSGLRARTHWMSVSDHGNVTLYRRAGNRWIEVWSVV